MKKLLLLCFMVFGFTKLMADDNHYAINFRNNISFEQLKAEAKKQKKPIFIDCFTTWCGPCKWQSANVFTDKEVGDFVNKRFISAKIDMEKGEGLEIAKQYGVRAYPTLLFIDADGKILHRTCGAGDKENFLETAATALNAETRLGALISKYDAGERSAEFLSSYLSQASAACMDVKEAVSLYWNTQQPEELVLERNWPLYQNFVRDYKSREFEYFLEKFGTFSNVYGKEETEKLAANVYKTALNKAINKDDNETFILLQQELVESKLPNFTEIMLWGHMQNFKHREDYNAYGNVATQYVYSFANDNSAALNQYAWSFYEDVDNPGLLKTALRWIERSIELEESYANTDTKAALEFKMGLYNEAKASAERALILAKESNEDAEGTIELLVKINEKLQ